MTELTVNLQDTINNTLQTVLGKNISCQKTSILLWTNANPQNSFILKKAGKKYLGLPRKDCRGETYWSFREIKSKSNQSVNSIAKFQQRQEKVKNYEQAKSINRQSH